MKITQSITLALIGIALVLSAVPALAAPLQGSAGNTLIRNQVTLTYSDISNNPQPVVTSNMLEISITTVNVAPYIKSVSPASGSTNGVGTTLTYDVEVVTSSNGPGTITLAAANGTASNTTPGTPNVAGNGASSTVFLGSSIIDSNNSGFLSVAQNVAAGASITFNIPNDNGVPTDSAVSGGPGGAAAGRTSVNALAVNDVVYIYDGTSYYGKFTVTAVNGAAVGSGTTAAVSSITLKNNNASAIPAFTPAYGWMVVESKSLNVVVTQGAVTGVSPNWDTVFTPSMSGATGAIGTVNTTATTASLTVKKYVRNASAAVVGATPLTVTINSVTNTYYQSGVTGKPGDLMEYLFVVNNGGTAGATKAIATDVVPAYTKLQAAYTGTGFAVAKRTNNATEVTLKTDGSVCTTAVACGNATGTVAGSTMTYYLGNNSASNAGGDIAAAESAYVIYQVKVD